MLPDANFFVESELVYFNPKVFEALDAATAKVETERVDRMMLKFFIFLIEIFVVNKLQMKHELTNILIFVIQDWKSLFLLRNILKVGMIWLRTCQRKDRKLI